nr:hypothetical protein [uncultured Pseudomonas sp.]
MNTVSSSVADNTSSKEEQVVAYQRGAAQCYYRPDTEELVFVVDSEAGPFESHWQEMATDMNAFHLAKADYSAALERYGQAVIEPLVLATKLDEHARAVDQAEVELERQREGIKKKLGVIAGKTASYDEVIELIPVVQGEKTRGRGKAPRYAYIKKGYFSKSQEGRKLHSVSLKGSEKDGGAGSIYSKDKNGNVRIDLKTLGKQLTKLRTPAFKVDLKSALKLIGSDFDVETLKSDGVLGEWAASWNNSLAAKEEVGANIDVSSGAQFMRYVSNVGANAQLDPNKKQGAFKGEAKASLALASGFANTTFYAPDRMGWPLSVQMAQGKAFDLGMLRVCVEAELGGFLGGSAQLEAQLQVVVDGNQQSVAGQPNGQLPRFRERRTTGHLFHQAMDAQDEGLQLSGEAFAGARVEGSLKGSIQWLKPAPAPDEANTLFPGLLKTGGQFTSFCTFGSSIAGLMGAGAGGKLRCTFINGKFCFRVAASLCWGAGAKGAFLAEVEAGAFAEFGAWLIYQLYSLDYSFFDVIDSDAFMAYSRFCVMKIAGQNNAVYRAGEIFDTVYALADAFKEFLQLYLNEVEIGISVSRERNALAGNIIRYKRDLLGHTPEAKGILLYLLTRHGRFDHFDLENRTLLGDVYAERKEAIICVLKSIQTIKEWSKVMCRVSRDGSNTAVGGNAATAADEQEAHLIRFMQEGHNRDEDLLNVKWDIQVIKARLKSEPALGYALALNDTVFYSLSGQSYSQRQYCEFGPCQDDSESWV